MLLFLVLGLVACIVHAMPTITAKGAKFFTSDGNQFFLKGVAYQLLPDDPLIDNDQCTHDADLMKTLGANSIRVYHVDPRADHDGCMKTFADAGIYIWLDLDTFDTYLQGPGMPQPQWNESQFEAYQAVMDVFHKYDNLGGFFVGNEVLTSPETDVAAPYVKAAAADMKAYRDGKNYRKIPIGYTAADVATFRPMLQNYLACGEDSANAVDFYGLNAYEWCGDSTYETSGYIFLQQNASEYNIPIFFSETGCNIGTARTFDDQAAIFGDKMVDTWSGAIIYEWIQETNNYGLVDYSLSQSSPAAIDGADAAFGRNGTPQPRSPDFENLSKHWATLTPTGIRADDYKPSLSAPLCPDFTTGAWQVKADAQLPTIGYGSKAASSSSESQVPTSVATATGRAIPGNGEPVHETAHATEAAPSATSSAAASGMRNAMPDFNGFPGTWLGLYVALCATARVFLVM